MRSLFFKIFLWFWLATILVAGALILSSAWGRPKPPPRPFHVVMKHLFEGYGRQAAELYEQNGQSSLEQYFQHLYQETEIRLTLVDHEKKDVLGKPLFVDVDALLRRPREEGPPKMRMEDPLYVAEKIVSAKGNRYIIFGQMPPGPMEEMFNRPKIIIARVGLVILVAGMVCYGLASYLTRPLRRLRQAARQLAEGDLTVRTGKAVGCRHDEIGELGRDFDFMAEELESLMKSQRRLLSDISHELRSPLTRLNVALELARQRSGDGAKSALDRIELEVVRLNELIGQLLTLARFENQYNESDKTKIDLGALLTQITEDADFEAQGRSRKVQLRIYSQTIVFGIAGVLRSAIENVVRNGIYYTPENSIVNVILMQMVRDNDTYAVIRVSDSGPGVPESDMTKIFQPFYRVADARDRHTGGVGLGLAITERAIRLHRGQINASNAPEGGLVVEIVLPIVSESQEKNT